ncbi:MAG: VanZ family protein [Fimbriimonadales bacterium]|nr:VanZ family protein [Fimbriimonadales bacterium]
MTHWSGTAGGLVGFGLAVAMDTWLGPTAIAASLALLAAFALGRGLLLGVLPERGLALYLALFGVLWALGSRDDLPRLLKLGMVGALAAAAGFLAVQARRNPSRRRVVWALAAALCSLLVALFSGGQGAPGAYPSWLELLFGLDAATAELVSTVSRKVLHFLFYGLFAAAAFLAAASKGERGACALALTIVALHAGADEARQVSHSARSGSVGDILLDLAGAVVFLLVASSTRRRRVG